MKKTAKLFSDFYGGTTTYHHFKAIYSFNMSGSVSA